MDKTGIELAAEAMAAKAEPSKFATNVQGHSELARALGVSPQVVQSWVAKGYAPVGRARQIGLVSGVDHRLLVDPVIRDLFVNP